MFKKGILLVCLPIVSSIAYPVSLWTDNYSYSGYLKGFDGEVFHSNPSMYASDTNNIKILVAGFYSVSTINTYTPTDPTLSGEKEKLENSFNTINPAGMVVSIPIYKGVAMLQFVETANYRRKVSGGVYNDLNNPPIRIGSAYVDTTGSANSIRFGYAMNFRGLSLGFTAGYIVQNYNEESLAYTLHLTNISEGAFEFRGGISFDASRFSKLGIIFQPPANLPVGQVPSVIGLNFTSAVQYPFLTSFNISLEEKFWDEAKYDRTSTMTLTTSVKSTFRVKNDVFATVKFSYSYLPDPRRTYIESNEFSTMAVIRKNRFAFYTQYFFTFRVAPNNLPWFSTKSWHRETTETVVLGVSYSI